MLHRHQCTYDSDWYTQLMLGRLWEDLRPSSIHQVLMNNDVDDSFVQNNLYENP